MELEGVLPSEKKVSQRKTDITCFHSYVEAEKLNRRPGERERKKVVTNREANHKRLLNTENREWKSGSRGAGKM